MEKGIMGKGQASVENLTLIGFAIVFIIPVSLLFLALSGNESGKVSLIQAKASARAIADAATEVYLQGAGARKNILVNYPRGAESVEIKDGIVSIKMNIDGKRQDVVAVSFANITGDLSSKRLFGIQKIRLVNKDGYYVNITYAN